MSDLHMTYDELLAQMEPDKKIRIAEMTAWMDREKARLGIDLDSPLWDELVGDPFDAQLTEADREAVADLKFRHDFEDAYQQSQREADDPIVKIRQPDGEITFCIASAIKPRGLAVIAGQRTGPVA